MSKRKVKGDEIEAHMLQKQNGDHTSRSTWCM